MGTPCGRRREASRHPGLLVLAFAFAVASGCNGAPGRRSGQSGVALVIGNGDYRAQIKLPNPASDARALKDTFRRLNFKVTWGVDLTHSQMVDLVREFSRNLEGREAIFFYAGHGIQLDNRNYLVPVDFEFRPGSSLSDSLVDFQDAVNRMKAARVRALFLDACRDNPFERQISSWIETKGNRGVLVVPNRPVNQVENGLGEIEAWADTLICLATSPGAVASDGSGSHSPFAAAILEHIETPGMEMPNIITRVIDSVREETNEAQVPWTRGSLGERWVPKPARPRRAPPP